MSETEELKKERDRVYSEQKWKEIADYIKRLSDEINRCRNRALWGLLVFVLGWGVWIATDIMYPVEGGVGAGVIAYIVGIFYMHWCDLQYSRAKAEMRGAIKVLQILNMIDLPDIRRGRRRKKRVHPFAGMAEKWARAKAKMRGEAYVPA